MKKLLQWFLVLAVMLLSCAGAYAEEPVWYELDEEASVLTVRLPANPTTGYDWNFAISDPEALELVTQEYVPEENSEQLVGSGGTWVASFIGTFKKAGNVDLAFYYARSGEDVAAETRLVELFVLENNQLEVVATQTLTEGALSWYELDEEGSVLTIRLPADPTTGYGWNFTISDPEALELATMEYISEGNSEVEGGTWVASFIGTFKKSGNVDLTLEYTRSGDDAPAETRRVTVFVVENNQLEILSAGIL